MPNTFATLATGIFDSEFGGDTGVVTVSQISGWLASNLGQLNVKLHTNFSGEATEMDESAGGIFSLMYLKSYYDRQAANALRGIIQSNGVLSIGDNDNKISFVNKNEVAKVFKSMSNDLSKEIESNSYNYSLYSSLPRQVVGLDCVSGAFY